MPRGEHAELQRQGAKAAARGDLSDTNPLLRACNRPAATGEAPDDWGRRCEAWRAGYEQQVLRLPLPGWLPRRT